MAPASATTRRCSVARTTRDYHNNHNRKKMCHFRPMENVFSLFFSAHHTDRFAWAAIVLLLHGSMWPLCAMLPSGSPTA